MRRGDGWLAAAAGGVLLSLWLLWVLQHEEPATFQETCAMVAARADRPEELAEWVRGASLNRYSLADMMVCTAREVARCPESTR